MCGEPCFSSGRMHSEDGQDVVEEVVKVEDVLEGEVASAEDDGGEVCGGSKITEVVHDGMEDDGYEHQSKGEENSSMTDQHTSGSNRS